MNFSVFIVVSRCGPGLDRCLQSVKKQKPDEIRAYIDPIRLKGENRKKATNKLLNIGAKVLLQELTSDSDEDKCREQQKQAIQKLWNMKLKADRRNIPPIWKKTWETWPIALEFMKVRAYNLAKKLRKDGNSYAEIGKIIDSKCSLTLKTREIEDWCEGRYKPKFYDKLGGDWSIHHSAHPDCVRNVHRAILECENKWVARVDDDDIILVDIEKILKEHADRDVGIIYGDTTLTTNDMTLRKFSRQVASPKQVNHIKGSTVILNRDAFIKIHDNVSHKPWQDFRRWYWILRAGYRAVYVNELFGHVYKNDLPDPRRLVEGGGETWIVIADRLDEKPLKLVA